MEKIEKPFWETTYSEEESAKTFNNGKPSWDVVEVLENRIHKGKVLDLGCGDGRNSLYAARLGYDVTAVDISEAGISKLNSLAINIFCADPKGVRVAARFMQIVIPSNIGVGFIFIFSLVLIIIGIKIIATDISSINAALKVEIIQITQKKPRVLV